jgi:hypothetical protein
MAPIVLSANKAPQIRTLCRRICMKEKQVRRGILTAWTEAMMAILNITLALVAAGLVVELFAAATAPLGYQDEKGFHLGPEKSGATDEIHSGNPS